ncbi:MAG: hypothetical protein ABF651_08365 [Sporolactobacillus sp.]
MNNIAQNLDLQSKGTWLPIAISILLFLYALFMKKKHMTWKECYLTFGCVGYMAWIGDTLTGNLLNLYDLGKPNITGLADSMSFALIPASLAVIFLNYKSRSNLWFLVLLFTLISQAIYWLCLESGYFREHGWHWFYSIIIFVICFAFIVPGHERLMHYPDHQRE